jgi:hypothetical protein
VPWISKLKALVTALLLFGGRLRLAIDTEEAGLVYLTL